VLGEVTLAILGLLLLIGCLGRPEKLICKTLESIAASGLVISLGVKYANAIQEALEFTRPGLVLILRMTPLYCVNRMVQFSLLVVALG
jgi:hypothetical protein